MGKTDNTIKIKGINNISLTIKKDDKLAIKMLMIYESLFFKIKPENITKKYNYSREYYYYLINNFNKKGSISLIDNPSGPKGNTVRTKFIENQIIRHRFLDPEANADVISKKLKQSGHNVSARSVERTIAKYGLQKKTLHIKSEKRT